MTDLQSTGEHDHGNDRPGMIPFGDFDKALRHEVQAVAERFPDTDAATVDAAVREVFADLRAHAEVDTHLLGLTRHRAIEGLKAQGHPFHPPKAAES